MFENVIDVLFKAGEIAVSNQGHLCVTHKKDGTIVTHIDREIHAFLSKNLVKIYNAPLLSEEGVIPKTLLSIDDLWIIDPLDGTKEYSEGLKTFSINISLIRNSKPFLSMIYAPLEKICYGGDENGHRFVYEDLPVIDHEDIILVSNKPSSKELQYACLSHMKTVFQGSSLKFCTLFRRKNSVYFRLDLLKIWDIFAGIHLSRMFGHSLYKHNTLHQPFHIMTQPFLVVHQSLSTLKKEYLFQQFEKFSRNSD